MNVHSPAGVFIFNIKAMQYNIQRKSLADNSAIITEVNKLNSITDAVTTVPNVFQIHSKCDGKEYVSPILSKSNIKSVTGTPTQSKVAQVWDVKIDTSLNIRNISLDIDLYDVPGSYLKTERISFYTEATAETLQYTDGNNNEHPVYQNHMLINELYKLITKSKNKYFTAVVKTDPATGTAITVTDVDAHIATNKAANTGTAADTDRLKIELTSKFPTIPDFTIPGDLYSSSSNVKIIPYLIAHKGEEDSFKETPVETIKMKKAIGDGYQLAELESRYVQYNTPESELLLYNGRANPNIKLQFDQSKNYNVIGIETKPEIPDGLGKQILLGIETATIYTKILGLLS